MSESINVNVNVTVDMSSDTPAFEMAPVTPAMNGSAPYGKMLDFSVESQRKMFAEEQERERKATEHRRASRRMKSAGTGGAIGVSSGVMMSGLVSNVESGLACEKKATRVGDDDDDSIISDDNVSLGSEESFYVGIEPADYAQPDTLTMYGTGGEGKELKEDRLGITRASAAVVRWERDTDALAEEAPPPHERGSNLHGFMTGCDVPAGKCNNSVVAMPLNARGVAYENRIEDDNNLANAQVYEQEAAEGKAFIEQLIGTSASYTDMVTPGKKKALSTPGPDSATVAGNISGSFPVLSPSVLFSPFSENPGEGEENVTRQLREYNIRKEASLEAKNIMAEKMMNLQQFIAEASKTGDGKVDAAELARKMEKLRASNGEGQ